MQGYPSNIATEAYGISAALGYTNGSNNVTVTVNNPPKSGNYTTNSSAVEVIKPAANGDAGEPVRRLH